MRRVGKGVLWGAMLFAGLASGKAFADEKGGKTDVKATGSTTVGAKVVVSGEWQKTSSLVEAKGSLAATVQLFNKQYPFVAIEASSRAENVAVTNRVTFKAGGYTLFSMKPSVGGTVQKSLYVPVVKARVIYFLAGVPVTVDATVGVGMYANLQLGVGVGASLQGKAGALSGAQVFAGVTLFLYRAGVTADLDFVNSWLESNLLVSPNGVAGNFKHMSKALSLFLELALQKYAVGSGYQNVASLELGKWTYSAMEKVLFSY